MNGWLLWAVIFGTDASTFAVIAWREANPIMGVLALVAIGFAAHATTKWRTVP